MRYDLELVKEGQDRPRYLGAVDSVAQADERAATVLRRDDVHYGDRVLIYRLGKRPAIREVC